jgi:phenylpropionate dioxygenase-like ring-hydroxylating dioxygenase large terminal subunit
VVCPYHGWAFDAEGRLRDVPSAEPGRWPKRPLLSSYPVVEQGGFVWLFFGDLPEDLRPPIPGSFVPELNDPKWHAGEGAPCRAIRARASPPL